MNTKFKVIGLTRLGIKPASAGPEADALTTRPFELSNIYPLIMKNRRSAIRACSEVAGYVCTDEDKGIPLSAFPNDTTSELAVLLYTVPLLPHVKQESCEYRYQFLNHRLNPTWIRPQVYCFRSRRSIYKVI